MKIKRFLLMAGMTMGVLTAQAAHLSEYDREIVATCMVLEAGGDGAEGMQGVLNVMLTRADGFLYQLVPQTIKRGAFSCMSTVWNKSVPDYSPLINRAQNQSTAYAAALHLISIMERGLLWDNTYGANHYHATSIRPYWVDSMNYTTTIGGHRFYTDVTRQLASL